MNNNVLVLSGGWQPICKISVERAICLVLTGKAYSVKDTEKCYRSQKVSIPVPSSIVIPNAKFFRPRTAAFKKRVMNERDGYKCVYCGSGEDLTLDHVIPRARWKEEQKKRNLKYGLNSYENCVTACLPCNNKKDHKLLSELGWPDIKPVVPYTDMEINWEELMA